MNKEKTRKKFRFLLKNYKKTGYLDRDVYFWTDEQAMIIYEMGLKERIKQLEDNLK